jgi:Uma2 family endonuclease
MGMPHAAERWTADRVRALPDDGNRYELVSGKLLVTPAPAPRHQAIAAALYDRLAPFIRDHGIGIIYWSPADICLGEDEVLQPDLFVFRTSHGGPPRSWAEIDSLLLAIEILSPGTERYDRTVKRRRYQRAGPPEYWVVDPDARRVERWRPGAAVAEVASDTIVWRPGSNGPALTIDLATMFAPLASDDGMSGFGQRR